MRIHFHVDEHDVGYMPDTVETFDYIDEAIEYALDLGRNWIDHLSLLDPDEPIRGQSYATEPKTIRWETEEVARQIAWVSEGVAEDEDYTPTVAKYGLLIVLEEGIRVIELSPCVDSHA